VSPGAIVACSTPASVSHGQIRSGSCAAANRVPRDTRGDSRFAPYAIAMCPMNKVCLGEAGPPQEWLRKRSASIAAMQPLPAAVTACR
jgi:hypothetical protein